MLDKFESSFEIEILNDDYDLNIVVGEMYSRKELDL